MLDIITKNFIGTEVTLGIVGLPVTISGEIFEVLGSSVGIRQPGGNRIYIDATKIAFFY